MDNSDRLLSQSIRIIHYQLSIINYPFPVFPLFPVVRFFYS